jgi:general L-amino acid transport system permease protein
MSFLKNEKNREYFFQSLFFTLVIGLFIFIFKNTQTALSKQNIASGFSFLSQEAGFEIGESLIDFFSGDSYQRALLSGLLNTLKVAIIGNVLAITLGFIVGVTSLSHNFLLAKLSKIYVESIRNTPLILQLFFWYSIFTEALPNVRNAISPISGLFLTNRGFYFVTFSKHWFYDLWPAYILMIGFIFYIFKRRARKFFELNGITKSIFKPTFLSLIIVVFIIWSFAGFPHTLSWPSLAGFNFEGGGHLSPEFSALLLGLVLYTSAFNAEIVRAGILSVDKGQWEAANSLGLSHTQTLSLIVVPQALRVAIPPLISQLLNLTKNSSLAVAIGYPDFVSVANTSLNITGQAVELVSLIMLVYLSISLTTSFIMNIYNKSVTLKER